MEWQLKLLNTMLKVTCPYCNKPAQLVTGAAIYKNRPDLLHRKFWQCKPCDAYVGCHEPNKKHGFTGIEPFGTLAKADLRKARNKAHAVFDTLWRSRNMRRADAYARLGAELNLSRSNCHISMMNIEQCQQVIDATKRIKERL